MKQSKKNVQEKEQITSKKSNETRIDDGTGRYVWKPGTQDAVNAVNETEQEKRARKRADHEQEIQRDKDR